MTLPVLTATPVCKLGEAVPVLLPCVTPASPVGVGLSSPGTIVKAVTVDLLPSGRTVVWIDLEVVSFLIDVELCDEGVALESVADCDDEPTVLAPPPIVVTTVTPNELVVVTIEPID